MKQSQEKVKRDFVCMPALASAALGLCLLTGSGFRVSSFAAEFFGANSESYFANSSPLQSAVTSFEREVRVQIKAPRRQASFALLPSGSELELSDVGDDRSLVEARCPALTTLSQPNDRGPPRLTA